MKSNLFMRKIRNFLCFFICSFHLNCPTTEEQITDRQVWLLHLLHHIYSATQEKWCRFNYNRRTCLLLFFQPFFYTPYSSDLFTFAKLRIIFRFISFQNSFIKNKKIKIARVYHSFHNQWNYLFSHWFERNELRQFCIWICACTISHLRIMIYCYVPFIH